LGRNKTVAVKGSKYSGLTIYGENIYIYIVVLLNPPEGDTQIRTPQPSYLTYRLVVPTSQNSLLM